MAEITFISNKTRKETSRYLFVIIFAVITWILQVSILNRIILFDTAPNLMLITTVFFGLIAGPLNGTISGIIISFLSASILYDHIFYFSYPLIGLCAGLLTKNLFSDELLFFILLTFLFAFPFELFNGWQYSLINPVNITHRIIEVGFGTAVLNLIISPFFYLIMNFITKKLGLR